MFLYFEDNAEVNKRKMKGFAITDQLQRNVQTSGPELHPMKAALRGSPVPL